MTTPRVLTNRERLEIERISQTLSAGCRTAGETAARLAAPGAIPRAAAEARRWVAAALAAVKAAQGNPYGDDDEAIAGEILRRIQEKRDAARRP